MDDINKLFNKWFPLKRLSRAKAKKKPWLTKALLVSIKHKNRLYRKYRQKPNNKLKEISYKNYKNKLTNILYNAEKQYYTHILLNEKSSSQTIWKVYRHLMGKHKNKFSTVEKLVTNKGIERNNDKISDYFNDYFCSIGPNLAKNFPNNQNYLRYLNHSYPNTLFINPVTENELLNLIKKLPVDKAPGLDCIPSNLIKCSADYIVKPLTYIFNLSFSHGVFPEHLKIAKVIPIFKKKDKSLAGNYRPISLLSIFNKLLEKLMYVRLYSFLTKFDILFKHQFGFRGNHSTILAIIEITDNIRHELDKGNSVIGTYLDLSKAFDTVNHKILLDKLHYYGIRGLANTWFESYLTNRKQTTFVNSTSSTLKKVITGVPQGSVLGPLLFLIYANDIASCSPKHQLRLFADDTNLFVSGKDLNLVFTETQELLNNLEQWFLDNQLTLNIEKTCYSIFTNKHVSGKSLFIHNTEIQRASSVKYLGVYLDENLTWDTHINNVCSYLIKLTGVLNYVSNFVEKEHAIQIYYAYVYPHITYGIEAYGSSPNYLIKKLQATQTRLLKLLFRKGYRESATQMFSESELLKCKQIYYYFLGAFVYKQQHRLLPEIFNNFFVLNRDLKKRTTRQSHDIYISKYRTTQCQKSVRYRAARTWNEMPSNIKSSETLHTFKRKFQKYILNNDINF